MSEDGCEKQTPGEISEKYCKTFKGKLTPNNPGFAEA